MNIRNDQRGVVSFIAVLFIAILLTIITTSYVRIMINEQRQSIDYNQSTRAYYAAEAGVEDAIEQVRSASNPMAVSSSTCTPKTLKDDQQISCQLIDASPNEAVGSLQENEDVQINFDDLSGVSEIVISWHKAPEDNVGPFANLSNVNQNPTDSQWASSDLPALMRANVISYPAGPISPSNVRTKPFFIRPWNTLIGGVVSSDGSWSTNESAVNDFGGCNTTVVSGYSCSYTIRNLSPSSNYVLRLRSMYEGTNYSVQVLDSSGNPMSITGNFVIIDVTGKAGNISRRVVTRLPLTPNLQNFGEDYALLSDTDICKNFDVSVITGKAESGANDDGCIP